MNQAGQLQLCAVMLAEARLVGRKVGEDVFVEAGVNYFFLYFGSYAKEGDGAIVCWVGFGTFFMDEGYCGVLPVLSNITSLKGEVVRNS